jgi:hypothetical protein
MDDFISEWTSYNTYLQNNYTNYSPAESANLQHFISHVKKTATVLGQMLAALADLQARLVPLFEVEIDACRIAPAEAVDFHDMIDTYGDWIANQREQSEGLLRCIERDTARRARLRLPKNTCKDRGPLWRRPRPSHPRVAGTPLLVRPN